MPQHSCRPKPESELPFDKELDIACDSFNSLATLVDNIMVAR